jgi:chemotaxis protein MotA
MTILIGVVIVLFSVFAGYKAHGGNMGVLFQPSEFLIIGGAALGAMVVATPASVLKALVGNLTALMKGGTAKKEYLDLLTMMYSLFRQAQQSGVMALETHAENPKASPVLSAYPKFLARHGAPEFLCDSLKVMIMGGVSPHDFEALMEQDVETHHHDVLRGSQAMTRVADGLPGLGIVAAVLGIVITMGKIDGEPAEIGHSVATALVGTFLGIFLAYGFVSPLSTALETEANDSTKYLECIKTGLLAAQKGMPPAIAVEFARRVLPDEFRPSFDETEKAMRGTRNSATAAAA